MRAESRKSGVVGGQAALLAAWETTLRRFGDSRAVAEAASGHTCTFRELDQRADAWRARQTPEPGAICGRAVVFAASNSIAWFEIFLALIKAGAVIVPLDAAEPAAAQRRLAEELRAAFWWDGGRLLSLPNPKRFRDPAPCLIKVTSGTTGRPRPLAFSAGQMLADGRQVTASMGIRVRDLNYALIPFGHSYGLGNLTLPLLAQGVPLVCGSAPLPQAIADDFARWRPTVFPGVPALWRALAGSTFASAPLRSLRVAISAGAPLPPEVAQEFAARFGTPLHSFYGSSETGGIAFDRTGAATLAGGVGRALWGVKLKSLRGQRLRVCSAGVFTQGNRRRIGALGCWVPPDAVTLDRRGGVTLHGRRGSTVKIGGRRVNLGEIAARLRRLAGVRDVWVGTSSGPEPMIGALVASDHPAAELRARLQTELPAWKLPKKWLVVPEFPLTARGKPDTRELRQRLFQ